MTCRWAMLQQASRAAESCLRGAKTPDLSKIWLLKFRQLVLDCIGKDQHVSLILLLLLKCHSVSLNFSALSPYACLCQLCKWSEGSCQESRHLFTQRIHFPSTFSPPLHIALLTVLTDRQKMWNSSLLYHQYFFFFNSHQCREKKNKQLASGCGGPDTMQFICYWPH